MLLIFSTLGIPALPLSAIDGVVYLVNPLLESKNIANGMNRPPTFYTHVQRIYLLRCIESSGGAEKLKKKIHIHVRGREGKEY